MANEMENTIKNAAATVAKYIENAATLCVETRFVEISTTTAPVDFESARPAAVTLIRLDGDNQSTVPLQKNQAGVLEVDTELLAIHNQNVQTAIEYRAKILNSLLGLFQR
jgi:hypothetical protein